MTPLRLPDTTDHLKQNPLVGLAGQQIAGKSTLFNMLTGANQYIANYPGGNVNKKNANTVTQVSKMKRWICPELTASHLSPWKNGSPGIC